jgi:hypothetical protein
MQIQRAAPSTVQELTALSDEVPSVSFGLGMAERHALLRAAAAPLKVGETIVLINPGAGCWPTWSRRNRRRRSGHGVPREC